MAGEGHKRFCTSCNRIVHDISKLTRRQAIDLMNRSPQGLCARMSFGYDGKVSFAPASKTNAFERLVQISLLGVSALGASGHALAQASTPQPVQNLGNRRVCTMMVRVSDPTGAPIPGAQVIVDPQEGPQVYKRITNNTGVFTDDLSEGRHILHVESPGFQTYTNRNLNLDCNNQSSAAIDVHLQIGVLMGEVVMIDNHPINPFRKAWLNLNFWVRRVIHSA